MSIKVMSHAWENSTAQGTELLCLLALADYANDEGEAYPGIKKLAAKCRVGERAVQKVLRKLEDAGEIRVEANHGLKTSTGHTNRYFMVRYRQDMNIEGVNAGTPLTPSRGERQDTPGVNARTPNPSVEPSVTTELPLEVAPTAPAPPPAPVEATPTTTDIIDAYVGVLHEHEPNVPVSYGRVGVTAKELAKAGWTPIQVKEAYCHLKKQDFWKRKHLSLQSVATQIGAIHAKRKPVVINQGFHIDSKPVDINSITF